MKKVLCVIMLLLSAAMLRAQDDVEYRMEIGGSLGLVSSQGH